MRRRSVLLGMCIAFAFLIVLAIQHWTEAQQPGRPEGAPGQPPRGQFRAGMQAPSIESIWAYVSFELGVADEVLLKAKKVFQVSWNNRKDLMKKLEEARGDREKMTALMPEAEKLTSDLEKKLKDILPTELIEKLAQWVKSERERVQRAPGPPPGGPPQGR